MARSISPDTADQLARLLHALVHGEEIANECACWQASETPDPRAQRFFRSQARQERFHARLFELAARWLAPGVSGADSRPVGLDRYRQRLESAMSRGNRMEVLIGEQIVLENLGELVLARLDAEMARRDLGFERLRRTLLRQEQAHQAFGLRLIDAELRAHRRDPTQLRTLADGYIDLADDILTEVSPLLQSLDQDADEYRREMRSQLPDWALGRC